MALVFMDGMDSYGVIDDIRQRYGFVNDNATSGVALLPTSGVNSLQCIEMNNDERQLTLIHTGADVSATDHYVGFWYYPVDMASTSQADNEVMYINAAGTNGFVTTTSSPRIMSLWNTDAGEIFIKNGNDTEIDRTTSTPLADGAWHWIEVRYRVSDTVGQIEVRVNEVAEINESSLDTYNGANDILGSAKPYEWTFFGLNADCWFDDIIVWDDTGTGGMTGFIGKSIIDTFRPIADGDHTDFTLASGSDHYAMVDETGTPAETDYADGSTNGNQDSFTYDAAVSNFTSFHGIAVNTLSRATQSGLRTTREIVRSGGVDYDGATTTVTGGGDFWVTQSLWDEDPSDNSDWTKSKFDALQTGFEIVS